jgi:Secretion system C-terminal sorting domain
MAQDSFRLKVNSVFQNVNKAQVPTQYLMEYGYPLLPMNKFNGSLVDSNKTDMTVWRMLYASFLTSYVGTTTANFPALSAVNTSIKTVETTGVIPISLLHVNYNDLRPDAVTAGLMTVSNEQIFDVAGRTQSPYRNQTLFAAAPSLDYSNDATTKFVFPTNLVYKNTGTINAISVDFADGLGYRAVTLGTTMFISYAVIGTYRIKVKITPSIGSVVESWFDFQVNTASCTGCLYGTADLTRFFPLNDPNFSFAPSASHSGGIVSVILSSKNNTGKIQKPLIVLKGFDANSSFPSIVKHRYDVNDFLNGINNANSDYLFNFNLDETAKYDLIFINYNNGSDDIKRNALLFQAVIRRVNLEKAIGSTEQNVVMGMSMGGLIARFGLAQMVRNGENPKTRLLITHDSPHRGANVPLSFQFMGRIAVDLGISFNTGINFVVDKIKGIDIIQSAFELNNLLNSTAAAQQIMLRATGVTAASVVTNTFLADGGEYRTMVDNVPLQLYQVIATSNGSQCAVPLFPPNTILLQGDIGGFITAIPWVYKSGIRTSIELRSAGNQVANQVVSQRVYTQTKIFTIAINVTISRSNIIGPAIKPFDGAPGGTIELPPSKMVDKTNNWWTALGYSRDYSGQPDFCFVPTGSALDATNFSTFNTTEQYVNGVNTTNPSNFTRFIAQNQFQKKIDPLSATTVTAFNSRHIRFLGRTSHWLFDQMENVTPSTNQECSAECGGFSSFVITGNSPFCTTGSYSVNTPTTLPVTWSVSPLGIATLNANGNTVTLTRVVDGNITLTAKLGAASCGTVTKSVQVGIAPPAFTVSEVQKPCPPTTNNGDYIINPTTANVTYSWQCSGCDALNVIPTQGASAAIIVNNSGSYTFSVLATTNVCITSTFSINKTFSTGTNCGILRIGISPNPVKTQLSLSVEDADDAEGKNGYQVTIADYLGNVKYDAKQSSKNAQIDIATLSSGTYSMRIIKGPKIVTKTFSVVK